MVSISVASRYVLTLLLVKCYVDTPYLLRVLNKSVPWTLAEFYFSRGLQRLYTGTSTILQKTINGFLCLLIVFLESKRDQLNFEGRD